jgi:hypothetical protein
MFSFAAPTSHSQLTNLDNDDHLQYLNVSGIRAMLGILNMGGFAITNAGNINGVNITAHASRHQPNGTDPLPTGAPTTNVSPTSSNQEGTANTLARSDHSHALSAANSNTNIQFNDAGSFAGDGNFTWEKVTNRLNVGNFSGASNGIILIGGSSGTGLLQSGGGALRVVGGSLSLESNPLGRVAIKTNTIERIGIEDNGAIQIKAGSTFGIADETASTLVHFDASKNVKSLPISTYPSLAEISYIKGITSPIQTQINAKEDVSNKSTDSTFGANSDTLYPSQKATRTFVEQFASGRNLHLAVQITTSTNLTASYDNGASGVGSTLTNSGAQVTLSIDGVPLSLTNRVLVKNQSSTLQNGVYTVTNIGSGSTNWVLTRATDFDAASEINGGDSVYVELGTSNAQTTWTQITAGTITVGTTPIVWTQSAGAGLYQPGNGISLSGNQFSLAPLASGSILVGNGSNVATAVPLSGDATLANTGVITIANGVVTFAKMQNIGTGVLLGRSTAGTGSIEQITLGAGLSISGGVISVTVGTTTKVSASSSTNTTSASDQVIASMTTTPGAGTYTVFFSASMNHTAANGAINYSIYANGVQVADSVRTLNQPIMTTLGATNNTPHSTQTTVTVGAGQAIDVRYNRGSSGTLTALQRSLIIIKQ